jgi:Tfp pilus assembly protein PilN
MAQRTLYKRINLIPSAFKVKQGYDLRKMVSTCVILSLIAMGLIYLYQITSIQRYKKETATYQMLKGRLLKEKITLENILLDLEGISEKENRIDKIATVIEKINNRRIIWSDVLKRITQIIPPALWLVRLHVIEEELEENRGQKPEITKKLILKGSSLDNMGVTDFLTHLEESGIFSKVTLEYSQKKILGTETVFDFEIDGEFNAENTL